MKSIVGLFFLFMTFSGFAQENANPYDVQVSVITEDGHFKVQAVFEAPVSLCAAYAFITDYEGAKNIPGIVESKIVGRTRNKVRVQRVIREQMLLFPIEMKSLVEYTETPNKLLTFEQLTGDNKQYRGSWKLSEVKNRTLFRYDAIVEPYSMIPTLVIEYFVRNSIRERFEFMAQKAAQAKLSEALACN